MSHSAALRVFICSEGVLQTLLVGLVVVFWLKKNVVLENVFLQL